MKQQYSWKKDQRGLSTVVTVLIVVLVAAGLGVGGYFGYNWWQDQAQKDTGTTTPTPPPTPPDPTAGWQVYADSTNGFSLKYPPNWTTKEGSFPATHGATLKDIGFFAPSPDSDKVFVTVRTNSDADLEAFVQADGGTTIQPAKVDSLDGFAAVTADAYRVYLGQSGKVYMFTFPGAQTNSDLTTEQVNLLTSFEFTSATPSSGTPPSTTNLQTYTDADLGFSFQYPQGYSVVLDNLPAPNQNEISPGEVGPQFALVLENQSATEKPKLVLWYNSGGYGPYYPDIGHDLVLANGSLTISNTNNTPRTKEEEFLNRSEDETLIVGTNEGSGPPNLLFHFTFNKGGKDYASDLKTIIESFELTQ